MTHAWLLFVMFGLQGNARAAAPVRVTLESARALLRPCPSDEVSREELNYLGLPTTSPGLLRNPEFARNQSRVHARAAELLQQKFGYTLSVIDTVESLIPPAFDGVIRTADDQIVANFILQPGQRVSQKLRKLAKYSAPDAWAELTLKTARRLAGHSPDDERIKTVVLQSQRDIHRFEPALRAIRVMIDVFGVGSGRPVWVLIDEDDPRPYRLRPEWIQKARVVERVFSVGVNGLTDVLAPCAGSLADARAVEDPD